MRENHGKEPVTSKTFCNISVNINSSRFNYFTIQCLVQLLLQQYLVQLLLHKVPRSTTYPNSTQFNYFSMQYQVQLLLHIVLSSTTSQCSTWFNYFSIKYLVQLLLPIVLSSNYFSILIKTYGLPGGQFILRYKESGKLVYLEVSLFFDTKRRLETQFTWRLVYPPLQLEDWKPRVPGLQIVM